VIGNESIRREEDEVVFDGPGEKEPRAQCRRLEERRRPERFWNPAPSDEKVYRAAIGACPRLADPLEKWHEPGASFEKPPELVDGSAVNEVLAAKLFVRPCEHDGVPASAGRAHRSRTVTESHISTKRADPLDQKVFEPCMTLDGRRDVPEELSVKPRARHVRMLMGEQARDVGQTSVERGPQPVLLRQLIPCRPSPPTSVVALGRGRPREALLLEKSLGWPAQGLVDEHVELPPDLPQGAPDVDEVTTLTRKLAFELRFPRVGAFHEVDSILGQEELKRNAV